ncbi:MAG: hypothetical protein ACQETL_08625 [Bacteroidota bacterium]
MILFDDHINLNLDQIAKKHYYNLIGDTLVDGKIYHKKNSLIGRIIEEKKDGSAKTNEIKFWNYLLNEDYKILKKLITDRPKKLKTLIGNIENEFGNNFFCTLTSQGKLVLTNFGKKVQGVFNYENFRKSKNCSDTYSKLNLVICPYCNDTKISVITIKDGHTDEDKKQALLQLDHFYSQSKYPYLSLSFFNLIPSCPYCNSTLKGKKVFDIDSHFNPYDKSLNNYFRFKLPNEMVNRSSDITIEYVQKRNFPDTHFTDLQIIPRYSGDDCKKKIFRIISLFKNYNPKTLASTNQQFPILFAPNPLDLNTLLEFGEIPTDWKKINNFSLGKLKRDIAIQLGVINP